MRTEQGVLRMSIAATVAVATFGIVFGLLSGSFSIVFDGVYALADAGMTVLALWVSMLIVRSVQGASPKGRFARRFTMGFWHLEPMVLGLNGVLLIAVSIYAFINAIASILNGGRELEFGLAIVYACVTLVTCLGMALYGSRANRSLQSDFVALDAKAWVMSGGITLALLIAFVIGYALQGTAHDWIAPYVDPAVLALVCLVIIPMPIGTVRQAMADVLLLAPTDLQEMVDRIGAETVARHGFLSHRSYVARVGRARQIELYFIVPPGMAPKRIEEWDAIRDEVGLEIGGDIDNRWLTIAFTADPEWAE
ncbi:predicted Co/Zn/Cd cation transporter (cation efflux family) [Rhizobium subbaraonis]|uniref:Predicted Co/Zn/Cd cation transporter (Cation efflux family) n=1 Tax=Rhizobium subbaraonis TaxID=908946 RepID=A0A285U8Z3_9HYPH|nr:cation transporter [Rhizobium subbaraonis]SOC38380.1 predicted Co/Zn/Cd cation transporter (cation efflux family) [Rhizobium subbaraonis]